MARPQAFERELRLATAGLEPRAIAPMLAKFAKEQVAKVIAEGRAPRSYTRIVNGRIGAPEESVIPPGPIVYDFNPLPEIIEYGVGFWRARSPQRSGEYRRSIIVMANGRQTKDWRTIPPGAEVIIVATADYARKIEVGGMRVRVPPGIAEDTVQALRRRFGNSVRIEKKFINIAGGYVLRSGRHRGQQLTYPAAVITTNF